MTNARERGAAQAALRSLAPLPWLVLLLALCANAAAGQTVRPGETREWTLGPLRVGYRVDAAWARVLVTVLLAGDTVGQQVLDPDLAIYPIDAATRGASVRGTFTLRDAETPHLSTLDADVSTRPDSASAVQVYRGSLGTWAWADSVGYVARRFDLTPELRVVTVVRGCARNQVTATFQSGPLDIGSISLTQASPYAVLSSELRSGSAWVGSGAWLQLTVPTALQTGSLFLNAQYGSSNIPATPISAIIATWTRGDAGCS